MSVLFLTDLFSLVGEDVALFLDMQPVESRWDSLSSYCEFSPKISNVCLFIYLWYLLDWSGQTQQFVHWDNEVSKKLGIIPRWKTVSCNFLYFLLFLIVFLVDIYIFIRHTLTRHLQDTGKGEGGPGVHRMKGARILKQLRLAVVQTTQ